MGLRREESRKGAAKGAQTLRPIFYFLKVSRQEMPFDEEELELLEEDAEEQEGTRTGFCSLTRSNLDDETGI
ncbi:hypothetical protein Nepgr_028554 [Nepenthes gracilis]|uniref:Uncharacterized protein n=1 Tax=Nepenthes gracilis TaxID=150966 RepID=A0AAD3TCR7_NEPGR|nr:hypothetical protein Nepgr_028554 [Nepenthes gracilis]